MRKIFLSFYLVIAASMINCNSSKKVSDGLPQWLKESISSFEKDNAHAQILEYSYNGKTVYYISYCYQCPDAMDIAYDKENNKLCEFGGFAGRNTCPDFSEKATNKKIIWQNKNFQY